MSTFSDKVKKTVEAIPRGSTMTYKEVATAIKSPDSARAVANVMATNFDQEVPCHRVIRSDGKLGGYNRGGTAAKRKLLQDEGAIM